MGQRGRPLASSARATTARRAPFPGCSIHHVKSDRLSRSAFRDWRWFGEVFRSVIVMPVKKTRHCWRKDLSNFRGLTDAERSEFLLVLEWFENFRMRCDLEAGPDAAEAFWRKEVIPKDRPRDTRQLEQWKNAIQWHLNWLDACAKERVEQRSLSERVRAAVRSAGARCGLAPRTIRCYEAWAGRYAKFARNERKTSQLDWGRPIGS